MQRLDSALLSERKACRPQWSLPLQAACLQLESNLLSCEHHSKAPSICHHIASVCNKFETRLRDIRSQASLQGLVHRLSSKLIQVHLIAALS